MTYHINENLQGSLPLLDQLRCIMLIPCCFLVVSKIAGESLLSPVAVDGVGDGRKRRYGLVHSRVLEELQSNQLVKLGVDALSRTRVNAP